MSYVLPSILQQFSWIKVRTCHWEGWGLTCQLEHSSNWTIIECSWHCSAVQLLSSWKIMQHRHLLIQLSCRTIDQLEEGQSTFYTARFIYFKVFGFLPKNALCLWNKTITIKTPELLYSDITIIKIRIYPDNNAETNSSSGKCIKNVLLCT